MIGAIRRVKGRRDESYYENHGESLWELLGESWGAIMGAIRRIMVVA